MDEGLLSLKWNNHHTTLVHLLRVLREQCFYTDAVLVCGTQFFGVHRLVLMACSDYFSDIFSQVHDCPKPVIVLQDMASSELEALLDYMYLGEVDVHQNKLPSLIKAAECLHIKGLAAIEDDPTKPLKTLLHSKLNKKNDNSSSVHAIPSICKGKSDRSSAGRNGQENDGENSRKRLWSSENSRNYGNNNKFSRTDHNVSCKKSSVQREPMSDSSKHSSSFDKCNSSANRSDLNDSSNVSRLTDDENNDLQYINDTEATNIKREDGDDGCSVKREEEEEGMVEHIDSEGDLLTHAGVKIEDGSHHFQQYLQHSNPMDDQLFAAEPGQSGSALNAAIASLPGVIGESTLATGLLPAGMRAAAAAEDGGAAAEAVALGPSSSSSSLVSPAGGGSAGGCSSSSWSNNPAQRVIISSSHTSYDRQTKAGDGDKLEHPQQGVSSSLPLGSTVAGVLVPTTSGVGASQSAPFECVVPMNYTTLAREENVADEDLCSNTIKTVATTCGRAGDHGLHDDRYYDATLQGSLQLQSSSYFDASQDRKSCDDVGSSSRSRAAVVHSVGDGGGGPSSKDFSSLQVQQTEEGSAMAGGSHTIPPNSDVLIIYSIHDLPKPHSVRNTSFSCGHCEKMFCHRGNFICHLGTHTGEKPYGCSLCQFRTSRKGNLESHIRSRHQNVVVDWSGLGPNDLNIADQ